MKKYIVILSAALALVSCNKWLTEDGPMVNRVSDYFVASDNAVQVVTAAYVPLMWEYQNGYFPEWYFGDIASDDALKGGQNKNDGPDLYDIDNFKVVSNNGIVLQFYRAQYQGIARANLALAEVEKMAVSEDLTQELKDRCLGEAHFLRAYYYFRLVRMFGGVPKVEATVYDGADWIQPRSTVEQIYELIFSDLEAAEKALPKKGVLSADDLGRATKGSQYSLCPKYADNFTLEGENGPESVFEIQYMEDGMSDYGEGNGFSRGTFDVILTRFRGPAFGEAGWGFNRPTQNLYDEFEAGDPRLAATILVPTDEQITNEAEQVYLGSRYHSLKRSLMDATTGQYLHLNHDSRGAINNQQIRLSDVYLMIAEVAVERNDAATAKSMLEKVRARARQGAAILPAFPGYNGYSDTIDDLRKAIRHERRVELAMEGHRFFDLCRWGVAKEVMDAYKASESAEVKAEMADFTKGKHELFPIPQEEVKLGSLEQNPNYS